MRDRKNSGPLAVITYGRKKTKGCYCVPSPGLPSGRNYKEGCWILLVVIKFRHKLHAFTYFIWLLFTKNMAVSFSVVFCFRTLTLGGDDEDSVLAMIGSCRPVIGSANHIALSRVIGSPAGSRVDGWEWFLFLCYSLLNVLLSI
ncbi:unnamed protein product [Cuscuta epithymum]|uniref:Uncharacterized protein n=1 Tax=Cuscuta epithymum TaxID=186058 RepID=A0AAV0FW86_9ASTE|nr:unnamed protein product [Cuscuta epithymum]